MASAGAETVEAGQRATAPNTPGQPVAVLQPTGAAIVTDGRPGFPVEVRFDLLRRALIAGGTLDLVLSSDLGVRVAIRWAESDGLVTFVAGPLVGHEGEASLTAVGDDTLVGRIVADGRLFVVRRDVSSTAHVVVEIDPQMFPPEAQPLPAPGTLAAAPAQPSDPLALTDSNAFVDLMVLYTPAARIQIGGASMMIAELTAAVNNANLALANAGTVHRYRLVHHAEIAYVETGDVTTSLNRLTSGVDGYMDDVAALRNQYRADAVTLLTTDSDACGVGWLMGPGDVNASFESHAFSVVSWGCANANLSLAHEIGHNMGLHHDRPNAAGSLPAFPYAYGYAIPGVARDVMAYPCVPSCSRRAIYSTPIFNFPGVSPARLAGTTTEDNARALNDTSLAVANFRQSLCTYALTSMSTTVGPGGGTGSVGVTAAAGCAWTATSNSPLFLTLTGGSSGSGSGTVSYFVSANDGAIRSGTLTIAGQTFAVTQAAAEERSRDDFDGDGRADVTVYRPSTGTWFTLKSSTNFTAGSVYPWGGGGDMPMPGDYDGDGKTDVTVYRPSTGTWFILASSTGYTTFSVRQWGESGDLPVPSDYDGDGKTDMAVYRPSTGSWFVLKSSTSSTTFNVYDWGEGGDVPVRGDYDGDGKTDITVYRPSTGTWFILKSSTSYTTFSVYEWGEGGDVPVLGDYDGDGKTDVSVYRPSTSTWFILTSSTNFTTFNVYEWGEAGDVPVPRDYDGDGSADVTVYRPSTGTWFILKSSTNFTTFNVYEWGESGDIPALQGR